jgi:NADH-quinone oxidoreductase subunit J
MVTVLFAIFAIIAIASAVLVVAHKNPVYSAIFLIITFFCVAGFFFLLGAQFLGIVQIIVYAGAIMVLFLFVIMLLNLRREVRLPIGRPFQVVFGIAFVAVLVVQILFVIYQGFVSRPLPEGPTVPASLGSVEALGQALFTRYLFPFEVASVLLLAGIIGAIILGRKKLPKEF